MMPENVLKKSLLTLLSVIFIFMLGLTIIFQAYNIIQLGMLLIILIIVIILAIANKLDK
ncbi:hypothetical protein MARBORIA2_10760 [Methanobrevibacter arboriphilus]|jgi:uncharacterized membrane protein YqjE|uniref:Uncharacterized protein n=1 Tax=Methanobrevibacter arboriphilus TaxID=39441 RepID=A0ACA8R5X8_METAZ|nr:hypothetical protein MarbSA_17860 [Methanobrevibacter arboriphilus]GLI11986.1 hypothetical protein MARBORIA2_10760 [Methanobrevibacter arboriphilus]